MAITVDGSDEGMTVNVDGSALGMALGVSDTSVGSNVGDGVGDHVGAITSPFVTTKPSSSTISAFFFLVRIVTDTATAAATPTISRNTVTHTLFLLAIFSPASNGNKRSSIVQC